MNSVLSFIETSAKRASTIVAAVCDRRTPGEITAWRRSRAHLDTATSGVRPSPAAASPEFFWVRRKISGATSFPRCCARGRAHSCNILAPDRRSSIKVRPAVTDRRYRRFAEVSSNLPFPFAAHFFTIHYSQFTPHPANLRAMEMPPPPPPAPAAPSLIEAAGLTKLYGEFPAVTDLSFSVRAGEVIGLVGPNGAGKTTTLRCLSGIIPPTRGAVQICGHNMARDPIAAKRSLAFFADEPRLFDYLTVAQHLTFTARIYNVADYQPLARQLLEELEIAAQAEKLPGELSRGMKQKLAIACGFLHAPRAIFFDEPLTGLDPLGIRRMKDSILQRAAAGAAILISSHLLHLLEEICSHVLILKDGRKIIDGSMDEVRRQFSEVPAGANLEEIFFRATGENKGP